MHHVHKGRGVPSLPVMMIVRAAQKEQVQRGRPAQNAHAPRRSGTARSREEGELAPRLQVPVDLMLLLEPVDALVVLLWNLESSRAARLGLAVVVEGLARVGREAE